MLDLSQFPQLPFDAFFKRLNSGITVTTTVVTPNRRLAQALKDSFNQHQTNQHKAVWHSADILPFTSFLERIYLDVLYSSDFQDIPLLLTSAQAHVLWEKVIQSSDIGRALLNITQTARHAYEAWQLRHVWRLSAEGKHYVLNDDSKVFQIWADNYETLLAEKHLIDPACLVDLIVNSFEQMNMAKFNYLFCYGFENLTPQQLFFLDKLQKAGCEVIQVKPQIILQDQSGVAGISRTCYVDGQEEIYRAAVWARSRLEANHAASIGVIVPALGNYRNAVLRIFGEVMQPDVQDALPQKNSQQRQNMPFNISLGLPLTAYPLVDTAFSILELMGQGLPFDRAGCLLRSPFLEGGESELNHRALLDMQLCQYAEPFITLEQLVMLIQQIESTDEGSAKSSGPKCPILIKNLLSLRAFRQHNLPRKGQHAVYAQLISQVLQIMGFPGERTLDSTEYQTLQKWHEVLADFATLDRVISTSLYKEAFKRLKYMAQNTLFQPQTPSVPIQILGVLEAAGMTFDHLWVMGLSDEQWPLRPRPNPFLPYELQKKVRIPMASTAEALNYSRQLKDGWLSCAGEVVLSHPKFSNRADAQEMAPSQMIRSIPDCSLDLPQYMNHLDSIIATACLESIVDYAVQPAGKREIKGGVTVIKDYAACPFRAWARHRVKIKSREEPHVGFNAMERGILVHHALCLIWRQLKTKESLDTIASGDLTRMLTDAANKAILVIKQRRPFALTERLAAIEQRRLINLVREWLDKERKRGGFSVVATEEQSTVQVGQLVLKVRLDRVDKLDDGQRLIIDYKTRLHGINTMLGERPDEPQLPLYLVMVQPDIPDAAGVVFASVKPGQMDFSGIAREQELLPGVKAFNEIKACANFSTWDKLIARWKQDFINLADGFLNGDASVLPKNYPLTCQYCEIKPFCRIYERIESITEEQDTEHD
ncbi:PD-(D/E)XK nuclease family protein [Nitrosomonas aestuarii]|uniref:PD-(D/E)XK nuclease family protein n=1 Tax=Nitrosomonas aestuarii TaxID=52441 RepID=UPI000D3066E4|nr:PD-(D/E)XK nuclease family protein [Nitrosomonas aestuarii]PTN10707.1 putative DNA repair protein [Nitrosomonas aestuarii]